MKKKFKIYEFLCEDNGRFSSTRLCTILIMIGLMIEWMHCVFYGKGIYSPDITIVSLVAGVLGLKVFQKSKEQKVEILPKDSDVG